ncbi:MAG: hypothetical protein Q9183_003499 [Haloplaca sp. 2 TL-2023]
MDNRKHPSDGYRISSGQSAQHMSTSQVASPPDSSIVPSPEGTRSNHQTRRLQLRNAGFRGQTLPTRRISPIFGSSFAPSEPFGRVVSNENSPNNLEKRLLFGEDLPPNPVNILQEIHNSARRKLQRPRQSIGTIFQDDTATSPTDADSGVSWYSETSNNNSPSQPRKTSIQMMKLREVSFNGRTPPPPLSSPLAKQTRSRNGGRPQPRSTSAEATKYIEHLESQLVAVNTKLDSLMSPSSHKARAARLRALTSEARSLRQQVNDWEHKFDERVNDERNQLANVEMSLTNRLQALEDEIEAKDSRVRDLEWEMEGLRIQVKEAEGLEAINSDLERRVDLLSSLLVQSPTKLDICSAASSPGKPDPRKRTPRPRSMMPRVPPSPGSMRLSLNIGPDMQFRRSRRSFASATSPSPSPEVSRAPALDEEGSPLDIQNSKDSSDLGSGNSSSLRSPPSSSSRPTSLHSTGSSGANPWGLPLPFDSEAPAPANQKQRRMRRFPSGAGSLKPLILPSASGTQSHPASAPVRDFCNDPAQRNFSAASLDPTIAFLSKQEYSSPADTPTQPRRQRSSSHAQRETMYTLEGRSSSFAEKDGGQAGLSPRSVSEELLETVEEEASEVRYTERERPRSLREELAEAGLLAATQVDAGLIPYDNNSEDQTSPLDMDGQSIDSPSPSAPRRRHQPDKPNKLKTPLQHGNTRRLTPTPKSMASTAIATSPVHGLFSRLTSVISQTKQGPVTLARRLIHNAWIIGVAKLGGMGWWLLGLVYGIRWRKKQRAADAKTTVAEVPGRNMDWHHFSPSTDGRDSARQDRINGDGRNDCYNARDPNMSRQTLTPTADSAQLRGYKAALPARHEPHFTPCPDCQEPPSRRSFRLWFRFSLAIILAVGIAIKDGPGALLEGSQSSTEKMFETWELPLKTIRPSPSPRTHHERHGPDMG